MEGKSRPRAARFVANKTRAAFGQNESLRLGAYAASATRTSVVTGCQGAAGGGLQR